MVKKRMWLAMAAGVLLTAGCDTHQRCAEVRPAVHQLVQRVLSLRELSLLSLRPSPATRPNTPPSGCADDMAHIVGQFCPVSSQRCLQHGDPNKGDASDHCQRYAPARCLSKSTRPMSFCIDRYEWPNVAGKKPPTLVSWTRAQQLCAGRGKRLCTADEFTFACEGEAMNAHVYGNQRDSSICHFDQRYIPRTYNYKPWHECMASAACKSEFARLDQRLAAGSRPQCVSPQGVFDLNGNVNEWVTRPEQVAPRRSGIKGGWWGPVRNRCRPMTTFHPEHDYGYEVGFRCCSDTAASS